MSQTLVTAYAKKQAQRFFCAPDVVIFSVLGAIQSGSAQRTTSKDPETERFLFDSVEGRAIARWNPASGRLIDIYPA